MKIVVVGGTGRLGSEVVGVLRERGHEVVAASPGTGFNAITGEGVREGLEGAEVVIDVSNSPSFADEDVLRFFTESNATLLPAAGAAGVKHLVALSIVGAERVPDSGYLRAKVAHEALVRAGGVPFTIVRATQFFEFVRPIVEASTSDGEVRLPSATLQPIAALDLAAAVADVAEADPTGGPVEVAGPEALALDGLARSVLRADGDPRRVVTDEAAGYFGAQIDNSSLTPAGSAVLGTTRFADWLAQAH